jgi:hypothetical protein
MAKKRAKKAKSEAPGAMCSLDENWRARNDLDTLSRMQEIVKDSGRFRAAKSEAKRQQESLSRISRLEGKKL